MRTWELEKQAGAWGVNLADRVLRFLGMSVLFHLALARLVVVAGAAGQARAAAHGHLTLAAVAGRIAVYALLPAALGHAVGVAARRRRPWTWWLTGQAPAPRAWDQVFSHEGSIWLRIRLKDPSGGDNGWFAGAFAPASRGPDSYASGFPHDQDIYLAETVEVDPAWGRMLPPGERPGRSSVASAC
ncbi:putative protein OS=Streptomyces alboniger OX=132473 GN=CP975_30410 PE=4 SV=1 [Streptomyces alboniger]